jgi:SAM-dependent methyltransferase
MVDEAHEKSKATWDEMAPGWERNREYMSDTTKHVAQWLVDHVDAREGDTILDIAGGPGDNGFLVADKVGSSGKVIETDFAPQMVEVAQRRAAALGLSNVETRVLDAEAMDLADASVDGIVCRWGFMLMIHPRAAMAECRRVLKDGRTMALSVWGGPEKNPWVTVPGMTMTQMGYPPGRDPFGPGGMFSLSDHDTLRTMLTDSGFTDVSIEEMPVEWKFDSFDHGWAFMTEVAGAIAAAVKEMPPGEVDRFRAALEDNYQQYLTDSGLSTPGVTINAVVS